MMGCKPMADDKVDLAKHRQLFYAQARWALFELGASAEILNKYKPIQKKDTHTLPNISQPNGQGHRNENIPWFWGMNIHGDSIESFHMEELYCVNYLWAKARQDRWLEEFKLVPWEMHWTMLYFQHWAEMWDGLGRETTPRKGCYARRQVGMWRAFQTQALADFQRSGAI
ncbi:uncharacterized protein LACBIDRAFT_307818 [Laccaria bicolor S238N-H82]|uniref:Predicted protein n=1 Tax=Laccaria bicolor (strain S238N-H82 / ATCC MYA-4686) TaxID=486041 RepID=B0DR44_LACBS|nr:uncharacterized protein LACBIDRAFT_307818 [Laccaria bicolor S238N-H82]EDR02998.1 predicted protein [Laccaria bicolor S238N-H82]|eukprot:XP_001886421.1 predicted protein [Laccaria bicolor S238N-H82]